MAASTVTVTINAHIAWWLKPYCYTLAAISVITGCDPNWERVSYWINKAVTVRVVR